MIALLYILSILLFHLVFIFMIEQHVSGAPLNVIVFLHVFFGIFQLIYTIPKIRYYCSNKQGK